MTPNGTKLLVPLWEERWSLRRRQRGLSAGISAHAVQSSGPGLGLTGGSPGSHRQGGLGPAGAAPLLWGLAGRGWEGGFGDSS